MLERAIDTGGPMGRMLLTVLGMVAEMELGFTRDRQRAGIDAAKSKGIKRAARPLSTERALSPCARKGCPSVTSYRFCSAPSCPLPICDAWRHAAAARGLRLARAYPSLGARCAQAWRDNARALPRAIL